MTSKQKILDAVRAKLESELSELKPCTNEYWDTEEELRKAECVADGYAEETCDAP
jgi:hypothetical protein